MYILDYGNALYNLTHDISIPNDDALHAFGKWAETSIYRHSGKGIIWELWNEPTNMTGYPMLMHEMIDRISKNETL